MAAATAAAAERAGDAGQERWVSIVRPSLKLSRRGSQSITAMVTECDGSVAAGEAFFSTEAHNPYLMDDDPEIPDAHARNRPMESSKTIVDCARLPEASPLKQLYCSAPLRQLMQDIVGIEELHLSACPFNSVYYNQFSAGDGLGWHFDNSEFGVNLVLQVPTVHCHQPHAYRPSGTAAKLHELTG